MKKLKVFLTSVICLMFVLCGSAFAAGTSVSSGFSWTVGNSYTVLSEWSDYNSHGHGVSISYDSNSNGFDYRRETYTRNVSNGSETSGTIYGSYTAIGQNSTAGILSSSSGTRVGYSVSNMETDSWGESEVNGHYVQVSMLNGDYNYESGHFSDSSGYDATTYSNSITGYVTTYSNTEFNY